MNFNLFISWIWTVCYCMANELQVKYVSNSETSDEHFIVLDVHEIEKREATPMPTPSLPVETTPITNTKTFSSHEYYTQTIIQNGGNGYWDELYNHTKHVFLSNDVHLAASGIDIKFTMPFYGHNVSRIQLTTGGFIYMGPVEHPFLSHSQYVAPLMANFNTKAINSEILYKEYENESIVVEWRNVQLNDENYYGQFTFQSKLFQNGTIMFIYKTVPVAIDKISTSNHSVILGVSDAFYYNFIKNGSWHSGIQRYQSVHIDITMIKANTVVILDLLPKSTNTAVIAVPIALILVMVGLVGGWMYYAYTRPKTASGQWLIEEQERVDNPETQATLGTKHRTKTNKSFQLCFSVKFKWIGKYKAANEDIESICKNKR